MDLLAFPPIESVPLSYLTLVALSLIAGLLTWVAKIKRDELRIKDRQIQAQSDKDAAFFSMVERQHTQMAALSSNTAESIYATNRVADAVAANTTAVKDSLREMNDSMKDGFRRTMALGEESNRAIVHTATLHERQMNEIHTTLMRLNDTVTAQYRALIETIDERNTGDTQLLASIKSEATSITETLVKVTVGLAHLTTLIDGMVYADNNKKDNSDGKSN